MSDSASVCTKHDEHTDGSSGSKEKKVHRCFQIDEVEGMKKAKGNKPEQRVLALRGAHTKTTKANMHTDGGVIISSKDLCSNLDSLQSIEKQSITTTVDWNRVTFENTYKLEPDHLFEEAKIRSIIREVLNEHLANADYEAKVMKQKCEDLSRVIKDKVKKLPLPRFKIVSMVIIGEKKDQGFLVSSCCLWDHRYDNFASVIIKHKHLCALGLVFGAYTE